MENTFADRVIAGEDGEYRWIYVTGDHHNYDICFYWLKYIALATVPIGVVMLVGGWNAKPFAVVLFAALCLLLMPVFLALFWRAFPPVLKYRLSDTEIETWPKSRNQYTIYELKNLRSITCYPEKDLILLHFAIARVRVYVPKEDYELAQEVIRARAPQGTEFFR